MEARLFQRDVVLMSSLFLLLFVAYSAVQNLETSLNPDGGLGSISLGLIYGSLVVSAPFAPAIIRRFGARSTMLVSVGGYWAYVAANLVRSRFLLLSASLLLGFAAATLWVAQSMYLVMAAKGYAAASAQTPAAAIGAFSGLFWGIYAANQILGNAITFAICSILEPSPSTSPPTFVLSQQALRNGTNERHVITPEPLNADLIMQNPSEGSAHLLPLTVRVLLGTFLACMASASAVGYFMRDQRLDGQSGQLVQNADATSADATSWEATSADSMTADPLLAGLSGSADVANSSDLDVEFSSSFPLLATASASSAAAVAADDDGGDGEEKEAVVLLLKSNGSQEKDVLWMAGKNGSEDRLGLGLMGEKKMLLLLPLLLYGGLQNAFISGDFTLNIVSPSLSPAWIGGSMAIFGAANALACFLVGSLTSSRSAIVKFLMFGCACHALVLGGLFPLYYMSAAPKMALIHVAIIAILWGVGDGVIQSQINSIIPLLFQDKIDDVFAQWKMWSSAATSILYFASPQLEMHTKIAALLSECVVAVTCLWFLPAY